MSKHTPGPWKYEARTQTLRSETGNYWLATFDSWDGVVGESTTANARLCAAAPELLEACKRAIPWLGMLIAEGDNEKGACPHDAEIALSMLEDAVKKAVA